MRWENEKGYTGEIGFNAGREGGESGIGLLIALEGVRE
jgi:hypothetical protein